MKEFGLTANRLPRSLIFTFVKLCLAAFAILQGIAGNTTLLPPALMLVIGSILLALSIFDIVRTIRLLRMNPRITISPEGVEDTSPAGQALGLVPWEDIEAVLVHKVQRKSGNFNYADSNVLGLLPRDSDILLNAEKSQLYLAYGITVNPLSPPLDDLLAAMREICPVPLELRDGFPIRGYPLELDVSHIVRGLYRADALASSRKIIEKEKSDLWPEIDAP